MCGSLWQEFGENLQRCFWQYINNAFLYATEPFAVCCGGEHGGSEDREQDGEGPAVPLGDGAG